jgi:AraC-like DNA-binding protein
MHPLRLSASWPVRPSTAGLFTSRGRGIHQRRVIDSHELILVRRGVLGMRELDRRFEVSAGEALLLRAGLEHAGTTPYRAGLSFYWIHFYLDPPPAALPSVALPSHARVARPDVLAGYLHRYLDDQESGRLDAGAAALLIALMLQEVACSPLGAAEGSAGADIAERAQEWIRAHFREAVSTTEVAAAVGCHPDHLGRVFRAARGCTVVDSIQRERLAAARRLLIESELPTHRVAHEAGFTDACYFRRVFRRHLGTSPLRFRRLHSRMHQNTD